MVKLYAQDMPVFPPPRRHQMAPFPLDELTHSATLVEAYSTDVILKRHCLVRVEIDTSCTVLNSC